MDDRCAAQIVRIGYAADWLARARQRVEQGDPARGLLALLLAEAEVRRATEVGLADLMPRGHARDHATEGGLLLAASVGAVLAAAAVVLLGGLVATARPRADAPLPALRLPQVGQTTLQIVEAPLADRVVERTVVRVVRVPAPAPPARREAAAVAAPAPPVGREGRDARVIQSPAPAAPPVPAGPPGAPTAGVPAAAPATAPATVAPVPPPLVSQADLIDLVLAAERSLRRGLDQ